MSGVDANLTKQDVAKEMQKESKKHGGQIPAGSYAAGLQHIVDSEAKGKDALIEERKSNLPLPDDPPGPSDFNSADQSTVNVGSGMRQDDVTAGGQGDSVGFRGPATATSDVRRDGDENMENTAAMQSGRVPGGIPSDAVSKDKRHRATDDTMN